MQFIRPHPGSVHDCFIQNLTNTSHKAFNLAQTSTINALTVYLQIVSILWTNEYLVPVENYLQCSYLPARDYHYPCKKSSLHSFSMKYINCFRFFPNPFTTIYTLNVVLNSTFNAELTYIESMGRSWKLSSEKMYRWITFHKMQA